MDNADRDSCAEASDEYMMSRFCFELSPMADVHSLFKDETHECNGRLSTAKHRIYCSEIDTSAVVERRLMRRIDLHVIPWLSVLYILSFMDRGSVGNAKVF